MSVQNGSNFEACYQWIKSEDPSRFIHFEQAYDTGSTTDVYCPMYPVYSKCISYNEDDSNKTNDYVGQHPIRYWAMPLGDFKYIGISRSKYPKFQGRIHFGTPIDHPLCWTGKHDKTILWTTAFP